MALDPDRACLVQDGQPEGALRLRIPPEACPQAITPGDTQQVSPYFTFWLYSESIFACTFASVSVMTQTLYSEWPEDMGP